jgi:hypothetical protein
MSRIGGITAACTLIVAAPAFAHHSFASYDRTKQVTINGVVKDFQWTNPHAWIQVVVSDAQEHSTQWGIECGSPNMMARRGWKRTLLVPGDTVAVVLNPLLDGRPNGSLVRVTLADGTVFGPGDAPKPLPLPSEK